MATRTRPSSRRFSIKESYRRITGSQRYRRVITFIQRRPFTSFLAALGILLLVLILGSLLSALNKKETKPTIPQKTVKTYTIGKAPTVSLQAQVDKQGVLQIVAQAGGVVQQINAPEGATVNQGQTIVSLSSNYQGGNAPALQAQLAGTQLKNVNDTYGLQKDIITRQRDIATASAENTEQLRQISDKSLGETRDLLSLNESLLNNLTDQISLLEKANPNDPNIPTLRGQQAQLQSGVNQLRSGVRSLEYQTNTQNPPTLLANTQKEITLKQLTIQEKALDLNRAVSRIQYNLALVQEGTMRPSAPFSGTVERVYVKVGQVVAPGTQIATIKSNNVETTVVLRAPQNVAESISRVEASLVHIGDKTVAVTPKYVSTVATDGQLYSIIYCLPDGLDNSGTSGEYVTIDVPVGYANTNSVVPFVPIDAVYESQDEASVLIVENKQAVARKVVIGPLYGEYVQIESGLKNGDQIILNRNIVAGDKVTVQR